MTGSPKLDPSGWHSTAFILSFTGIPRCYPHNIQTDTRRPVQGRCEGQACGKTLRRHLMTRQQIWATVACLALFCWASTPVFGQAVYGSIFGTVTDPSGAA